MYKAIKKKLYNNNKNHAGDFPSFFPLQNVAHRQKKMKNRYHFHTQNLLCIDLYKSVNRKSKMYNSQTHSYKCTYESHAPREEKKEEIFEHTMGHASERKTHGKFIYYPPKRVNIFMTPMWNII